MRGVCVLAVPSAVRARGGGGGWVSQEAAALSAEDLARIEKRADKIKRSRLAFAGFV